MIVPAITGNVGFAMRRAPGNVAGRVTPADARWPRRVVPVEPGTVDGRSGPG